MVEVVTTTMIWLVEPQLMSQLRTSSPDIGLEHGGNTRIRMTVDVAAPSAACGNETLMLPPGTGRCQCLSLLLGQRRGCKM